MKPTLPKITIITPSYNQGKFIERTIKSVIGQNYPNLEYIVMDGGSTDQTLSILNKYSKAHLPKGTTFIWRSEPDGGQTTAINKGLHLATGEIVAYLNSDDTYLPGSLEMISLFFTNQPTANFVYGQGDLIDSIDTKIGEYNTLPENFGNLFASCGISQPTCFWRKKLLKTIGLFDESYQFTMDYDYWIRVSKRYPLYFIPIHIANTRIHKLAKTSAFAHKLHTEAINVSLKHYGRVHYDWVFTYADSLFSGKRNSKQYFRFMMEKSLYFFWSFNHTLPPWKGMKIIMSWFRNSI